MESEGIQILQVIEQAAGLRSLTSKGRVVAPSSCLNDPRPLQPGCKAARGCFRTRPDDVGIEERRGKGITGQNDVIGRGADHRVDMGSNRRTEPGR